MKTAGSGYPLAMANHEQDPTEVGAALHGDRARTEEHPQPTAVAVPSDTLIAQGEADDAAGTAPATTESGKAPRAKR